MKYKDFKKELERKKNEEATMKELNDAIATLTKKRDNYIAQAKDALKKGNTSLYNANVALLKNAIFNLKQAQDMVVNFTIAKDMMEMQTLNKHFVKSLDSVMKNVYKTCKAIHVSNSEKTFMKALFLQTETSRDLKEALNNNNVTFASSVNTLSDISDSEVGELLGVDMTGDATTDLLNDDSLDRIESLLGASPVKQEKREPVKQEKELVGGVKPTSKPEVKPETKPEVKPQTPKPENKPENKPDKKPEDELLGSEAPTEAGFIWDNIPVIGFDDIAGLDDVKELVRVKVLLPLKNPEAFEGYEKKNGGGLCLYGPPGTGKTMIAAAIAHEIGAKFCSVKPSDLLQQGVGNSEKAVRRLFQEARKFPCAVIYFDEMDSISPKNTRSSISAQLRSEFLAQLQGVESYGKDNGNLLFLVCATNKPWNIDSAFLRPGRFGTKVYVGLPDEAARKYIINKRLEKIKAKGVVEVRALDLDSVSEATNGFNCSDVTNLMDKIEEISIVRGINTGEKYIGQEDFDKALEEIHSSVQLDDLVQLKNWKGDNDK